MKLFESEMSVIAAAEHKAARLGSDPNHTVAAAAMDAAGTIHTGVNAHHFTGGPCANRCPGCGRRRWGWCMAPLLIGAPWQTFCHGAHGLSGHLRPHRSCAGGPAGHWRRRGGQAGQLLALLIQPRRHRALHAAAGGEPEPSASSILPRRCRKPGSRRSTHAPGAAPSSTPRCPCILTRRRRS